MAEDPAFAALLERIAEARSGGASLEQMMGMATAFLEGQPEGYAAGRRDELLEQVRFLAGSAAILEGIMGAAQRGDQAAGLAGLAQMMGKLAAAEPPEARERRRADAMASMAQWELEHEKAMAARRAERAGRGLCPEAGTGVALRRVMLVDAGPGDEFELGKDPTYGDYLKAKAKRDAETAAGLPLGASRIGGLPDLPKGMDWPTFEGKRIPFVAQVNVADLPAESRCALPADGHLLVFALISNEAEHWPPPVAVRLFRGPAASLVRAERPAGHDIRPDWGGVAVYDLLPAAAAVGDEDEGDEDGWPEKTVGWIFGEMAGVFGTPAEIVDPLMLDGEDWINLLAVFSVGNMQWSDCGHLYVLIRRSELERLEFGNVVAMACSS